MTKGASRPALVLFSVLWAAASTYHVTGVPGNASSAAEAALAVGIAAVALAPGHVLGLALLAVTQLATMWSAAPVLANHWLLAGFVNLAILVAAMAGRGDATAFWTRFAPAARLTLLGFYGFAAFAKVNEGFFDPERSCATFYLRESAESLGLDALADPGRAVEWAAVVGVAGIELAIPLLLVWRRTRRVGVVVAIAFHALVALDRTHEFFDFSSVLLALFVLFLPERFGNDVVARARPLLGGIVGRLAAIVVLAGPVALSAASRDDETIDFLFELGWWTWQALAATGLVVVALWLVRWAPDEPVRRRALAASGAVALVPVLVVLNGLTPYLEVKTAFGWNMYGNLRTVDGDSNHYLVRSTWPLGDGHDALYEIVETDDPALRYYLERRYALPERTLRAYLAEHPEVSFAYRRNGGPVVRVARASDEPRLADPVPEWERKLLVFRPVDLDPQPRCQDVFGPIL